MIDSVVAQRQNGSSTNGKMGDSSSPHVKVSLAKIWNPKFLPIGVLKGHEWACEWDEYFHVQRFEWSEDKAAPVYDKCYLFGHLKKMNHNKVRFKIIFIVKTES